LEHRDAIKLRQIVDSLLSSIAADGRILEIHDMTPKSERAITSSRSCRYALEMNQGWFAKNGVQAGEAVVIGLQ
jgi:uncharacterized membrane protein (UPF0127 family)